MECKPNFLIACTCLFLIVLFQKPAQGAYYVSTSGNDTTGNGSTGSPWATITHALDSVPDSSLVLVRPGTYNGRIRIRGTFTKGVTVRSEIPYKAKLRHNDTVITAYQHGNGVRGIDLEGFDIAHTEVGSGALVVHIDGGGNKSVTNITLKNNILHDSYNNDILKINNACAHILVEGNMFYNQTGSDEHIDINSVEDVVIQDNVFFNDFEGSGRNNNNNTSSYIVIKDSNGNSDSYIGSRDITVQRNIFFNWEGSTGSNFVLIGEDGNAYFEGYDIIIENNLFLGNSDNVMRSSVGVKGGKDILFRNNTISGDLPSLAFAMRLNREGSNPPNQNIQFYNNIWSDPTGTMGAEDPNRPNDFSDTPKGDIHSFILDHNIYWNGGVALPYDSDETVNYTDDINHIQTDPKLTDPSSPVIPRWNNSTGTFNDGATTIRESFEILATTYCVPATGSSAIDSGTVDQAPLTDIFGKARPKGATVDIGACEYTLSPSEENNGSDGMSLTASFLLLLN